MHTAVGIAPKNVLKMLEIAASVTLITGLQ